MNMRSQIRKTVGEEAYANLKLGLKAEEIAVQISRIEAGSQLHMLRQIEEYFVRILEPALRMKNNA